MAHYTSEEMAMALNIKRSTLRKYSLILEKKGYDFLKNDQGHRWFGDTDLIALRKFITLKEERDMSLDEAADTVLAWKEGLDIADLDTPKESAIHSGDRHSEQEDAHLPVPIEMMERMQHWFEQQQEQNKQLQSMLRERSRHEALLQEEMSAMRQEIGELKELLQQQALPEPEPEPVEVPEQPPEKRKGLFGFFRK